MILEAADLHYAYPGGVEALAGLDLRIAKGSRLAILGPNGAGKTTLLLHLNGTLKPSQGSIALDGKPVAYDRRGLTDWRRRVGLVLQDPDDQLFAATVKADVSFGPLNLDLPTDEVRTRVEWALDALRISDLADRPTHMLSFGQKKRAAIAGAAAMAPEVLLLDEPAAGLDAHGEAHLLSVLKRLAESGTTLVFTTHDVDLAWGFADQVALFKGGKVLAQGETAALLADADLLRRARLKQPWAAAIGLAARAAGTLAADAPLPKDRDQALALLQAMGT
ncbi:MAG: ATP-binding cassette domain-containing protein [Rhodospirillales bacterium]|nr:ATP-binding cassette domain-containing protein [Rhodospirillales bacterium]